MKEVYVIMRFDVDYNGYSQEPVCVMLEDTYEQRVKAAVECGLYNEVATKFAEDRRWESHDGCTGYFITKVDLID
jgi:hypothetical protein